MHTKDEEIEKFREKNKFYTTETMRQLELERELTRRSEYRKRLYDWVMAGKIGIKPKP